ncbi:Gfo/Idh/MocA family oxidoreductase [Acidobacteria bacterium AH-259-G07]|nr:Gfo/Idh/MocA family oxidoreductase [Acidobacteria bacterium AH-259-G07]
MDRSAKVGFGLAASLSPLAAAKPKGPISPNNKIVLGIVGIRGRGTSLAKGFAVRPDCEVAYLADVDASLFADRVHAVEKVQGKAPKAVQDFRRVLDDKSVDAIAVATPDHWHALATIWGCQAGKDVLVEKPVSHTPWEGRQMVKAARKYKRVVQVGTQSRSAEYMMKGKRVPRQWQARQGPHGSRVQSKALAERSGSARQPAPEHLGLGHVARRGALRELQHQLS